MLFSVKSVAPRCTGSLHALASFTAGACVLVAGFISPAAAQEPSPFAATPQEKRYPTGERLKAQYATAPVSQPVPIEGKISELSVHKGAAAALQSELPPGFKLAKGSTSLVMAENAKDNISVAGGALSKYFSLYALEYNNIPLAKGSDYLAILDQEGHMLSTRKRGIPTSVDATTPSVAAAQATAAARTDAGASFAANVAKATAPQLEIFVDSEGKGHLSWNVTLETASLTDPEGRTYWIAATGSAQVLHWESTIYHTHFGTVTGTAFDASPLSPAASHTLDQLTVTRTGGGGGSAITGEDGRYTFVSGTGSATIGATLSGPYFAIQNMAGAVMTRSKTGTPASAIDLNFGASGEFELAQPTAFYWANMARDVASGILSPTDLLALPTRVNLVGACNAYWNGSSINFFRAGGGCPNMAYSDVVLHEYGHGVDSAKGGILNGGYSEGFGDALAILGTKQPCVGRDFFGAGTCLRNASDAAIVWPSPSPEVHEVGRRYAGFVWDLVQQLKKTYADEEAYSLATRLVMAAAAANPNSIPDAVYLSFVADDTDNNLATCSPHFKELAAAADLRHIPRPVDCRAEGATVVSSAQFPWVPSIGLGTNSNIASATITIDKRMEIHVVANSSARAAKAAPAKFTTGFYIDSNPNVMWTDSYRDVTIPAMNNWTNFGSTFAVTLNPGTYTFYWKIWTTAPLAFSAGSMLVEAFPAGPAPAFALLPRPFLNLEKLKALGMVPKESRFGLGVDGQGMAITRSRP